MTIPQVFDHTLPVPAPPDDSTWYSLDPRAGWREAIPFDRVEPDPCDGALALARTAATRRRFDEPSGSLGGLVLPANTAMAGDTGLYLLDRRRGRLLWFDPCTCAFEAVRCRHRDAGYSGRFANPRAMAARGATLYVAEAGDPGSGGRVSVWPLPDLTMRAEWRLPPSLPGRPQPWRPVAVAVDPRGAVWVGDFANAMVHKFDRLGRLRVSVPGMGGVRFIGLDCAGRVYVVLDGEPDVQVLSDQGVPIGRASDPAVVRDRFANVPVRSDAQGRMRLDALCVKGGPVWADLDGTRIEVPNVPPTGRFETAGTFVSGPLDSQLHRCQWHRVLLRVAVPVGTHLTIDTYTADTPIPSVDIDALPETAWATRPSVAPVVNGEWDALVRSGPGRYLWLRVSFAGDGTATPRVCAIRVEYPRVSLRHYLPAVWSEDAEAADFTDRFLAVFDAGFRDIERRLDTQASLYDPLSTPSAMLPWLASWIGASLGRQWPERTRRRFLKHAADFFRRQGTRDGLRAQLLFFLGIDECGQTECDEDSCRRQRCEPLLGPCSRPVVERHPWRPPELVLEHYQLRRWLFLGSGRLGDQAVLWGQRIVNRSQLVTTRQAPAANRRGDCESPPAATLDATDRTGGAQVGVTQLVTTPDPLRDPFHVHAHRFTVFIPAARVCTPERKQALSNVIAAAAPAHTRWFVEYVEPRFRIGFQSAIGLDAVVGRYPRGVSLGAASGDPRGTTLGGASVLGGVSPPHEARVGSTAHL